MIDSHCHLNLSPLGEMLNDVISGAMQSGVTRILAPGITVQSWKTLQQFSERYRGSFPIDTALGLHPYFLTPSQKTTAEHEVVLGNQIKELEVAASNLHFSVKAIGETGLDGHIDVPMQIQKRALQAQLSIANSVKLPVILHHRKSHHLLFEALKLTPPKCGGVVHAFSGSIDDAKRYIDKGFCLGIGGTITYERAQKTRATVRHLVEHNLDALLLETDAPDMPMQGRQGQPNLPRFLPDVVSTLQALSGIDSDSLINATSQNYQRLFLKNS